MSNNQALSLIQQASQLLSQAASLLQGNSAQEQQPAETPAPEAEDKEEITIKGTIGRPEIKQVGKNNLSLFTAGLKVGREWINIQAWRKTAEWAGENLQGGSAVTVHGEWTTQQWVNNQGQKQERTVFSVRAFEPV